MNTAIDVQRGQGLEFTKWNECSVLFVFKFCKSKLVASKEIEYLRVEIKNYKVFNKKDKDVCIVLIIGVG